MEKKNYLKVFIATSSFDEDPKTYSKNFFKRKNITFIKNPLKKKLTQQQLIKYAKDCDYIIAGTEEYNQEIIDNLKKLKFVFRMGSGIENIDIEYLKKKKINFSKSKITPEIAVAELIVGYSISFFRDIFVHNRNLKNKIWKKKMGLILNGKTFGIIGYGKIGKYLHKLLKNFGVNVLINEKMKIKQKNTKLDNLIKNSDIISINVNSNNNIKLLNEKNLKYCKKNCLIINTSRSEVLDYEYLFKILKDKRILGACLDVFDEEPYAGKLSKLDNVILTPHIGGYSKEIRKEMEKEALMSILKF